MVKTMNECIVFFSLGIVPVFKLTEHFIFLHPDVEAVTDFPCITVVCVHIFKRDWLNGNDL